MRIRIIIDTDDADDVAEQVAHLVGEALGAAGILGEPGSQIGVQGLVGRGVGYHAPLGEQRLHRLADDDHRALVVERAAAVHDAGLRLPETVRAWFAGKGWTPRPHQLDLLGLAENGRSVLLIAPTGAGKTLAGFLPRWRRWDS